jgi:hypothetical protein
MKWVELSVKYSELYIRGRVVKAKHVLKRVSDHDDLFLFSSIGHERVSVWCQVPSDYTIEEYASAVRNNNARLKEMSK